MKHRAWRREFEAVLMRHESDEHRREVVEKYWTEAYPIIYDEDDDVCMDERVHDLLIRRLTPGRLTELSKKMKEKLATGLDEFTGMLVDKGGEQLAELFAKTLIEELKGLCFAESWITVHATLIPKPGKDRCKLSGWREIWVQSHLWKMVVGAILPELSELINKTRPWCNAGFTEHRGCPEMSLALRCRIELAMLSRKELHLYFQDYSVFFPSLSRQLVSFILHEIGVPTEAMQILREFQDTVMGSRALP